MVMECNCSSEPAMLTVLGLSCMGVEPRDRPRGKISPHPDFSAQTPGPAPDANIKSSGSHLRHRHDGPAGKRVSRASLVSVIHTSHLGYKDSSRAPEAGRAPLRNQTLKQRAGFPREEATCVHVRSIDKHLSATGPPAVQQLAGQPHKRREMLGGFHRAATQLGQLHVQLYTLDQPLQWIDGDAGYSSVWTCPPYHPSHYLFLKLACLPLCSQWLLIGSPSPRLAAISPRTRATRPERRCMKKSSLPQRPSPKPWPTGRRHRGASLFSSCTASVQLPFFAPP